MADDLFPGLGNEMRFQSTHDFTLLALLLPQYFKIKWHPLNLECIQNWRSVAVPHTCVCICRGGVEGRLLDIGLLFACFVLLHQTSFFS